MRNLYCRRSVFSSDFSATQSMLSTRGMSHAGDFYSRRRDRPRRRAGRGPGRRRLPETCHLLAVSDTTEKTAHAEKPASGHVGRFYLSELRCGPRRQGRGPKQELRRHWWRRGIGKPVCTLHWRATQQHYQRSKRQSTREPAGRHDLRDNGTKTVYKEDDA